MNVIEAIKPFGCYDAVHLSGDATPRHLDYLDLLKLRGNGGPKVDAVAEFQARPLLYVVSADSRNLDKEKIIALQCLLANRGERAYLGFLSPGELNVYPLNLDKSVLGATKSVKQNDSEAPLFFQSIVSGVFTLEGQPDTSDYIFETIHELLSRSSKILIDKYKLNPLDVLSFLGRALFFRFLSDRKIICPNDLGAICPQAQSPSDCFENVNNSIATCRWLDETFNGDLLPFSNSYAEVFGNANTRTKGIIFKQLQAIIEGSKHVGEEGIQGQLNWGDLDFAHIPIGVISQVYESFSRIWDSQLSENTSVYYTPKNIARYLVDDGFEVLADKKDACVLDSSCGAGIFLVLAFRKLVAARWEHDGKRPDTKTIQSILYNQLCGFDVSESALRLAALSLYITAIELNPSPRPPKSLKFLKPLREMVLYNHRRPEEKDAKVFVLGSLHPDISTKFDGSFDLVVGNPPWSRLRGKSDEGKKHIKLVNAEFTRLTRQILKNRGLADIAEGYSNPDNVPDLPFLWKAAQWAKPNGIIAMALPGRMFLKQTPSGVRAFEAILRGIEITGILNCSNLSDSAVWPEMAQPFMLFFARNRLPAADYHFHFVTPHFEKSLNDKGRIRIDYQSAQTVAANEVIGDSNMLKVLAVGTSLDVELVRKINELKAEWPTVGSYWDESHGLYSGLGYNLSPKRRQYDATFMYDLPDFTPPANDPSSVSVRTMPKFKHPTAHMPRCIELYTPPLLIVPKSPGSSMSLPKSWIMRESAVFSSSYYGFSAYGSGDANLLIAVLHLITHSELFRYYVLTTSPQMGTERRVFHKEDVENFPFPPIDMLSKEEKQNALALSQQLETAATPPLQGINDFIFKLYDMDKYDRQVVKDTLAVAAPYEEARTRANEVLTKDERKKYYSELQRLLLPSFTITEEKVSVDEIELTKQGTDSLWHFFTVSSASTSENLKGLISQVVEEANKKGCSRVIVHGENRLLIGIIGQYRYWTLSRARLCALDILRYHLNTFPIGRS